MNLWKGDEAEGGTRISTSTPNLPDEQRSGQSLHRIQRSYLSKIKLHIREALVWMLSNLDESAEVRTGKSESPRPGCDSTFRAVEKGYHPAISIWYVMKHCPAALSWRFFGKIMQILLKSETKHSLGGPTPDWEPSLYSSTEKQLVDALSTWYHFGCLHQIHKQLADRGYQSYSKTSEVWSRIGQSQNKWRRQCENLFKSLRKTQGDLKPQFDPVETYTVDDELLDRFVVLGKELEVDVPGENLTDFYLRETRAKLKLRKHTTSFRQGKIPPARLQSWNWKPADTSPPWELYCLNHHIRCIALPNLAEDDYSLEAKKNCRAFMFGDYTFAKSWDRSHSNMVRDWWAVEVSCVVCFTLLDEMTPRKRTNLY